MVKRRRVPSVRDGGQVGCWLAALVTSGVLLAMVIAAAPARAGVWSVAPLSSLDQDQSNGSGNLTADSCVAGGYCMALGVDDTRGLDHQVTLEEVYNGGTWTRVTGPAGFAHTYPAALSCSSMTYCMAVGLANAALWNGTSWRAVPSGGVISFTAVSCAMTTCMAVGTRGRLDIPVAELWRNGVLRKIVAPLKAVSPDSVYCGSSSRCIVVGDFACPAQGRCPKSQPFAESWNGHSWAVMKGAGRSRHEVDHISCVSLTWCMGVGSNYSDIWNGRTWTYLGPAGHALPPIVSCVTAVACEAVGSTTRPSNRNHLMALASEWNGHGWTNELVPDNGAASSQLVAVSCASTVLCTAVGNVGTEVLNPLAESWQPS